MNRKKLFIALNAAIGPALFGLATIAAGSEHLWVYVAREDGGMHGALAVTLVLAMIYSFGFQLWLIKLVCEPRISRAFDEMERRRRLRELR